MDATDAARTLWEGNPKSFVQRAGLVLHSDKDKDKDVMQALEELVLDSDANFPSSPNILALLTVFDAMNASYSQAPDTCA